MPKKTNLTESVRLAATPVADRMGLVLWDVLFVKEGPSWFLRLFIDKEGGVTIDDCEAFSRAVDPIIDELDPIETEYCLEVSSPGLARELRTDAHLAAYVGKEVRIRLYKKNDAGVKEAAGELAAFDGETVSLAADGGTLQFRRSDVAAIRADDDKDLFGGNEKR